ncbi:MAG: fibronectin type III domain-containing protein [Desulfobacterales bacterium]|nr:fibronectin type III domain-containing protein [Desulfobacterales bacterium]
MKTYVISKITRKSQCVNFVNIIKSNTHNLWAIDFQFNLLIFINSHLNFVFSLQKWGEIMNNYIFNRNFHILFCTAVMTALIGSSGVLAKDDMNAPSDLVANATSAAQIVLTWQDNSPDETGFKIEMKTGGCNSSNIWEDLVEKSANSTTHTVSGLSPNTTYAFKVRAFNDSSKSDYSACSSAKTSAETSSTINAPSNLAAKAKSSSQIVIGWKDNSTNETGFKIERKSGGCDSANAWEDVAEKPVNSTSHTVSGLNPNTTYAFKVKAFDDSSQSENSNCTTAKTGPAESPPSPTNFKAASASSTKINLSWNDNSTNESGFKIYRKTGTEAWGLLTTTGPNVKAFSDSTASNNSSTIPYQYYILAFNNSGNSPSTYTAVVPYQPVFLTATQGATSGSINLKWTDKSTNETGFEIYRKTGPCSSTSAWTKIATLGVNKTSWTNTGLTAGNSYSYRVRAYKKSGSVLPAYGYSLYSNCASMTATPENSAPVANSGVDQNAATGERVMLNGSASSDADGDSLTYSWSFSSVPPGNTASLSAATTVNAFFTPNVAGTYVISLTVNDGKESSAPDTVSITVAPPPTSFANNIQPIFNSSCTSCHSSGGSASFLNLQSTVSYGNLVNKAATKSTGTRVIPGDSANSVLYKRVIGTSAGGRMPPGSSLSASNINLIQKWIDEGAANN